MGRVTLSKTSVLLDQQGKTDHDTIASPGRDPDQGLTAVVASKLDADPCLSAKKLAQSLGIAASTV
jgi:hypothetical protein